MEQSNLYGIAVIAMFAAFVVYVFIKERNTGRMNEAFKDIAVEAQKNTRALDLAENLAVKVVPVELVNKVDSTLQWAKNFTPDSVDLTIDEWRKLLKMVTDGKPNDVSNEEILAALGMGKG